MLKKKCDNKTVIMLEVLCFFDLCIEFMISSAFQ